MQEVEAIVSQISPALRTSGEAPTKILVGGVSNMDEILNDIKWSTYLAEAREEKGRPHYTEDGRVLIIAPDSQVADIIIGHWIVEQRFDDRAAILPVVTKSSKLHGGEGLTKFNEWVSHWPRFDEMSENAESSKDVSDFIEASKSSYFKSIVVCTLETLSIVSGALGKKLPPFDVIAVYKDLPHSGKVTSISRIEISNGIATFPTETPRRIPAVLNDEDVRFIRAVQKHKGAGQTENSYRLFSRSEKRYLNREDTFLATVCKEKGKLPHQYHVIDLLSRSVRQNEAIRITSQLGVEFGPKSAVILRYPKK